MILIAAMTQERVIGKDGTLPWHISEDLKLFKKHTLHQTVLMGRKTYASIGKPLPQRNNIVVSTTLPPTQGIDVCSSIDESLTKAVEYGKELFVIGGAKIYETTLPYAEKLYISQIHKKYDGDTFFPKINDDDWNITSSTAYEEFTFFIYTKKRGRP